jgi:hypothetical protein
MKSSNRPPDINADLSAVTPKKVMALLVGKKKVVLEIVTSQSTKKDRYALCTSPFLYRMG